MYLKFMVYPEKDTDEKMVERTIECSEYVLYYDNEDYEYGKFFLETIGGNKVQICYLPKTVVFVMNDRGKTIDKFIWSVDEELDRIVRH